MKRKHPLADWLKHKHPLAGYANLTDEFQAVVPDSQQHEWLRGSQGKGKYNGNTKHRGLVEGCNAAKLQLAMVQPSS